MEKMSSASEERTTSQAIPARTSDNVVFSTTPGGTVYGTTPGGTKLIYDRTFLMSLRESPISKTPPTCSFPCGVLKGSNSPPRALHPRCWKDKRRNSRSASIDENCETFRMDL